MTDGGAGIVLVTDDVPARPSRTRGRSAASTAGATAPSGWACSRSSTARPTTPTCCPTCARAVLDAFDRAHVTLDDVDGFEVHDCFTPSEYLAIDHIGLTGPGRIVEGHRERRDRDRRPAADQPQRRADRRRPPGRRVRRADARSTRPSRSAATAGDYQVEGAKTFGTLNFGGSTATTVSFVVSGVGNGGMTWTSRSSASILSTLPEDDDHPYRTGPWRPQTTEWDADDLDVVEGEIPRDLDGVYLRNTENPLHPALKFYHPFDGDGMVHVVGFRDGKAFYRNRFVRTDGFAGGERGRRPAVAGPGRAGAARQARQGLGRAHPDEGRVEHRRHRAPRHRADQLLPVRRPVPARPVSGRHPGQGGLERRASRSTGACRRIPKVDDSTGELLFFNYSKQAPYMHYGVVDANDELVHYVDVPLPGPRLPHDMAFTENYAILNDFPLFWDPELLAARRPPAAASTPTCRRGSPSSRAAAAPSDIRWFEADPTYVLHFTNAYEDGDEIVLDGFFQGDPAARSTTLDGRQVGARHSASSPSTGCRPGCTAGGSTSSPARSREEQLSDSHHRVRHDQRRLRGRRLPLHLRRDRQARLVPVRRPGQARPADRQPRSGSRSATACTAARPRWRRASAAPARTTATWSRSPPT